MMESTSSYVSYRDKLSSVVWADSGCSLTDFLGSSSGSLPQVIRVLEGFRGRDNADTLDSDQLLILHDIQREIKILAKDNQDRDLFIPKNFQVKVEIVPKNSCEEYRSVRDLLRTFPRFFRVLEDVNIASLRMEAGSVFKIIRQKGYNNYLECIYTEQGVEKGEARLPLELEGRFQPLQDGREFFIDEVFTEKEDLPVSVRFVKSSTLLSSTQGTGIPSLYGLGNIRLLGECETETLFTTILGQQEKTLAVFPRNLSVTVLPVKMPEAESYQELCRELKYCETRNLKRMTRINKMAIYYADSPIRQFSEVALEPPLPPWFRKSDVTRGNDKSLVTQQQFDEQPQVTSQENQPRPLPDCIAASKFPPTVSHGQLVRESDASDMYGSRMANTNRTRPVPRPRSTNPKKKYQISRRRRTTSAPVESPDVSNTPPPLPPKSTVGDDKQVPEVRVQDSRKNAPTAEENPPPLPQRSPVPPPRRKRCQSAPPTPSDDLGYERMDGIDVTRKSNASSKDGIRGDIENGYEKMERLRLNEPLDKDGDRGGLETSNGHETETQNPKAHTKPKDDINGNVLKARRANRGRTDGHTRPCTTYEMQSDETHLEGDKPHLEGDKPHLEAGYKLGDCTGKDVIDKTLSFDEKDQYACARNKDEEHDVNKSTVVYYNVVHTKGNEGIESDGMESDGMESDGMKSTGMESTGMESGGMESTGMESGGMKSGNMDSGGMESGRMESGGMESGGMESHEMELRDKDNGVHAEKDGYVNMECSSDTDSSSDDDVDYEHVDTTYAPVRIRISTRSRHNPPPVPPRQGTRTSIIKTVQENSEQPPPLPTTPRPRNIKHPVPDTFHPVTRASNIETVKEMGEQPPPLPTTPRPRNIKHPVPDKFHPIPEKEFYTVQEEFHLLPRTPNIETVQEMDEQPPPLPTTSRPKNIIHPVPEKFHPITEKECYSDTNKSARKEEFEYIDDLQLHLAIVDSLKDESKIKETLLMYKKEKESSLGGGLDAARGSHKAEGGSHQAEGGSHKEVGGSLQEARDVKDRAPAPLPITTISNHDGAKKDSVDINYNPNRATESEKWEYVDDIELHLKEKTHLPVHLLSEKSKLDMLTERKGYLKELTIEEAFHLNEDDFVEFNDHGSCKLDPSPTGKSCHTQKEARRPPAPPPREYLTTVHATEAKPEFHALQRAPDSDEFEYFDDIELFLKEKAMRPIHLLNKKEKLEILSTRFESIMEMAAEEDDRDAVEATGFSTNENTRISALQSMTDDSKEPYIYARENHIYLGAENEESTSILRDNGSDRNCRDGVTEGAQNNTQSGFQDDATRHGAENVPTFKKSGFENSNCGNGTFTGTSEGVREMVSNINQSAHCGNRSAEHVSTLTNVGYEIWPPEERNVTEKSQDVIDDPNRVQGGSEGCEVEENNTSKKRGYENWPPEEQNVTETSEDVSEGCEVEENNKNKKHGYENWPPEEQNVTETSEDVSEGCEVKENNKSDSCGNKEWKPGDSTLTEQAEEEKNSIEEGNMCSVSSESENSPVLLDNEKATKSQNTSSPSRELTSSHPEQDTRLHNEKSGSAKAPRKTPKPLPRKGVTTLSATKL